MRLIALLREYAAPEIVQPAQSLASCPDLAKKFSVQSRSRTALNCASHIAVRFLRLSIGLFESPRRQCVASKGKFQLELAGKSRPDFRAALQRFNFRGSPKWIICDCLPKGTALVIQCPVPYTGPGISFTRYVPLSHATLQETH